MFFRVFILRLFVCFFYLFIGLRDLDFIGYYGYDILFQFLQMNIEVT